MTRHRKITPVVGLCLALAVAMPGAAQANPILSGYGGPGQGNQAILGSALLNSPGGGGSAGGGSGASGAAGEIALASTVSSAGSARAGHGGASGGAGGASKQSSGGPAQLTAQSRVDAAGAYLAAERGHATGQPGALGLGGQDVLYIIVALGALALAAALTRRLTQTTAAGTQR